MRKTIPLRSRWVYWQGVFLMLLVFLAYERWLPGGSDLTPQNGIRGWIEIILIALAFLIAISTWGPRPFLNGFSLNTFICLILFGALATVSALWSPNFQLSLGKAGGLVLIILLACAIAFQSARLNLPVEKMTLAALILVGVFLLLVNLVQFQTLIRIDWSSNRPRLLLAYEHPNTTAELFGAGLLTGMYILMSTRFSQRWLLYLLAVISMASGLVLTDSRGAFLATLISVSLLLLSRIKPKYWFVIALISITALVIGLLVLNLLGYLEPVVQGIIAQNPDWATLNGRLKLWTAVVNNPLATNLIGVGYSASRYILVGSFSWGLNSHNSFLEVFITVGVTGLLIILAFYAVCLSLLKHWRAYPLPLAMLIYASIHSLIEVRLFAPDLLMFITCIFIFHQQFLQKTISQSSLQPDPVDRQHA